MDIKYYYLQDIEPFNKIKFVNWDKVNPKYTDTMDCAIRVLSILANISWEESYRELFEMSLKNRTVFNDRIKVLDPIFNKYGYKYNDTIKGNVATFIISNMDKDFIIVVKNHIFTVKHGVVYDRIKNERNKNYLLQDYILGVYAKKYSRFK